jgi:hypothetical protein
MTTTVPTHDQPAKDAEPVGQDLGCPSWCPKDHGPPDRDGTFHRYEFPHMAVGAVGANDDGSPIRQPGTVEVMLHRPDHLVTRGVDLIHIDMSGGADGTGLTPKEAVQLASLLIVAASMADADV